MNSKQLIFVWGIGVLVLLASNAYASFPEIRYYPIKNKTYVTDAQLKEMAIQKEIVPADFDNDYLRKQMEVNNTIATWVVISREEKLKLIESLKTRFKDEKDIIIKMASEFYVDEINAIVYDNIAEGIINKNKTSAVGYAFRVIAMMIGDYDNGKNRVKALRNYVGEEIFNRFIEDCPDMYKHLIELDEKSGTYAEEPDSVNKDTAPEFILKEEDFTYNCYKDSLGFIRSILDEYEKGKRYDPNWDRNYIGIPNNLLRLEGYGLFTQRDIIRLKLENIRLKRVNKEDIVSLEKALSETEKQIETFVKKNNWVD